MKKLLVLSVLFLAACGGGEEASVSCANSYELVNAERGKHALPSLSYSLLLEEKALAQANKMAEAGAIFHSTSLTSTEGENVAGGLRTVEDTMSAFMASAGHRKNILLPYYKSFGAACVSGAGPYYGYWVQIYNF